MHACVVECDRRGLCRAPCHFQNDDRISTNGSTAAAPDPSLSKDQCLRLQQWTEIHILQRQTLAAMKVVAAGKRAADAAEALASAMEDEVGVLESVAPASPPSGIHRQSD